MVRTRPSSARGCKAGWPAALVLFALVLVLFSPAEILAQTANPSHWGVSASVAPSWKLTESVRDLLADEGETVNIEGSEFTVGFVRGSTLGGDWGVSFVRKPWKDGLGVSSSSTDCFNVGPQQGQVCLQSEERNLFQGVALNGMEVHWFIAPGFARIKNRVQIGANIGGGFANVGGSILTIEDRDDLVFTPGPGGGKATIVKTHTEETRPAADELVSILPLFKVEIMGAVIATPALKIKFAGGLNFPGSGFRVLGVYLFGAR